MKMDIDVNGQKHSVDVAPEILLSDFLRDDLGLTGTKIGCDTGQCGACVVLVDGISVKSCSQLAVQAADASVRTVESLSPNGKLNLLQEGFQERHGTQCGFCTPGMLMSLTELLEHNSNPSEADIRRQLDGNLCRCTGYQNVVAAVEYAIDKANSPVKMALDTPFKHFYANQVRCLIDQDPVKLVETNYHPDATVQSHEWTVTGHEALKAHFANYMHWVKIQEVLSTDHYAETANSIAFEATIKSSAGIAKVYDVMLLRDGKVYFHFTGTK